MNFLRHRQQLQRVARWAVVLALCLCVGAQWIVLQGIAWTGMLIEFSQQGTIAEAVSKTFDGEHPCPLCKAVKQGVEAGQSDNDEQAPGGQGKELKLTLALTVVPKYAFPRSAHERWSLKGESAAARHEEPETPPPQAAC